MQPIKPRWAITLAVIALSTIAIAAFAQDDSLQPAIDGNSPGNQVMLSGILFILGMGLKRSPAPDWVIPFALLIVGGLTTCALTGFSSAGFVQGAYAASGAIMAHQMFKQAKDRDSGVTEQKDAGVPGAGAAGLLLIGLLAFSVSGCKTAGTNGAPIISADTNGVVSVMGNRIEPEKVAAALELGARFGAKTAIEKDPNARSYFQLATVVLGDLVNSGTYDSVTLEQAMDSISVKEIRDSEKVQMVIRTAVSLYSALEAVTIQEKLDRVTYLVPCLKAIQQGLGEALSDVPVTPENPAPVN